MAVVFDTPGWNFVRMIAREPWLASLFSWYLPGSGQYFTGRRVLGVILLLVSGAMIVLGVILLVGEQGNVRTAGILLGGHYLISFFSAAEAFRYIRRHIAARRRIASRDPYLALFLSWLFPGLGHLYGRKYLIGAVVASVYGYHVMGFDSPINPYARLTIIVSSAVIASHAFQVGSADKLPRGGFAVLLAVTIMSICTNGIQELATEHWIFGRTVSGWSMHPTLQPNDFVLCRRIDIKSIKRGDVLLFNNGKKSVDPDFAKRVVAWEREVVQIKHERIYCNGFALDYPPFAHFRYEADTSSYALVGSDPFLVPKKSIFVLGDNPSISLDSRQLGGIVLDRVEGRIYKIVWPLSRSGVVR